jgi:hypothetical protein
VTVAFDHEFDPFLKSPDVKKSLRHFSWKKRSLYALVNTVYGKKVTCPIKELFDGVKEYIGFE